MAGTKEYFPGVSGIEFEGVETDNPFAFRYYQPDLEVRGKALRDHLRFACAYWHSFCNDGSDPFGRGARPLPWLDGSDAESRARNKMDAAFEFMGKIGVDYFCFHDFDLIEEADTLAQSTSRLNLITDYALEKMAETGIKVLWGTANLFSNPRYMNGAATNPDFDVVTYAAAQVRNALDATIKLGGENYVFWGGREGYLSLLNTDMKCEQDHLARFLKIARDYAREKGFEGTFFIEPKPCEPSKHQYDYDAATVVGFLHRHGLEQDFKLNIEVNHATLAGHTFEHELQVAADHGMLGSIDANRGDHQNGWDTDQFPNNLYDVVEAMLVLLRAGGLQGGGVNFDAKLRRNSSDLEDLFLAHIGGMDLFARALIVADRILSDSPIEGMRSRRYSSFQSEPGRGFEDGNLTLADLYRRATEIGEPKQTSGQQELYENVVNRYL